MLRSGCSALHGVNPDLFSLKRETRFVLYELNYFVIADLIGTNINAYIYCTQYYIQSSI